MGDGGVILRGLGSRARLPRLGWDGVLPQARQASCCYSRSGLVWAVLCKCDPHSGRPAPQLSALYCIPPLWLPSLPTRCSPLSCRSGLRKGLLSAGGSEGLASAATSMRRAKDTLQQWMVGWGSGYRLGAPPIWMLA